MRLCKMVCGLALVLFLGQAIVASATTISYVGADTTVGPYFRTSNKPGLTKPMDVGATAPDNIYGTDGTVFFNPTSGNGFWTAWNANISDLHPTYFASVNQGNASAQSSNYSGALDIDNSTLSGVDPVADRNAGYLGFSGSTSDLLAFSMTLGEGIPTNGFRVGVFVNFLAGTTPSSINLQIGGVSATTTDTISDDATGSMEFFDVKGASAGDVLEFRLSGSKSFCVLSGVTFDTLSVPEPSTIVLLCSAVAGLLCYAWRKQK